MHNNKGSAAENHESVHNTNVNKNGSKLKAITLLNIQKGRLNEVINVLKKIQHITRITSVTGDADVIIHIEVDKAEQFHDIFANIIDKTPGVNQTKTYIVMKEFILR